LVYANILHVPDDFSTIQEALDSAGTNDTVLVAPGIYCENIVWPPTQGIDLLSDSGSQYTIIDGDDLGRVITLDSTALVDTSTVIWGFTITNGRAIGGGMDAFGAGIFCNGSSPKVVNNVIGENVAYYSGGGMACKMCAPVISGNFIYGNLAVYNGGGICCSHAHPAIDDNTIEGNSAGYNGGGINLIHSEAVVWGNAIYWNNADNGGGINCNFGDPEIEYNWIEENDADVRGGGVCLLGTSPVVRHNFITGNDASGAGDGIHCSCEASPLVYENDIFANGVGILNEDDTATVIAQDNWWGHPSGPFHPSLNPDGCGDEVSDYVEFHPWLTEPYGVLEGTSRFRVNERQLRVYPNPFVGNAEIRYSLRSPGFVALKVYDLIGREISTLIYEKRMAGNHSVHWQPGNLPSGVYFIRLRTQTNTEILRCLLMK
jgi:hypothetical protein